MSVLARIAAPLAVVLIGSPALAHSGAGHSTLLAGLLHPLGGWDHLAAMLAVGLWAGTSSGHARWAWPLAFVLGMAAGGTLGMLGLALPATESAIAFSMLALGCATAAALRMPVALGVVLVAMLALTHGNAHGLEAPEAGAGLDFAIGFLLTTAALHVTGLAVGVAARRSGQRWLARGIGIGIALGGAAAALG